MTECNLWTLQDVYVTYDGVPMAFSHKDSTGVLRYYHFLSESESGHEILYLSIITSRKRLNSLIKGKIDLHKFLTRDPGFLVKFEEDGTAITHLEVSVTDLKSSGAVPEPGVFLMAESENDV